VSANVVVEGSEVEDATQPCTDALFVNATVYPSLFFGQFHALTVVGIY